MSDLFGSSRIWFFGGLVHRGDRLEIGVLEGITAPEPTPVNILGVVIENSRAVEVKPESRRLVIAFPGTILYQVTPENLCTPDSHGEPPGSVLRSYGRSDFLTRIEATTAVDAFPGKPYGHHSVVTEEFVIDVISNGKPAVEERARGDT